MINQPLEKALIFNSIGQVVYKGSEKKIDISALNRGVYVIVVETTTNTGSQKLVIIND